VSFRVENMKFSIGVYQAFSSTETTEKLHIHCFGVALLAFKLA